MNHTLFTTLSALSISSALLIVGAMAASQPARPSGNGSDAALIESLEADAMEAAGETAAPEPRKQRVKRGALSMPYFSFARSLRPGG